jgi:hypothetical protein
VKVKVDRTQRPHQQPPERDPRRRNDAGLEAAVPAQPAQLDPGGASRQ